MNVTQPAAGEEAPPHRFRIDIYSDTACPLCYVGKKHLDTAIDLFKRQNPDAEFELSWKPFMLVPTLRNKGKSSKLSLISRLGSRSSAWLESLRHMAAQYGIDLRWDGTAGDSHDSHKLILLAMDRDAATPVPGDPNARQNATVLAIYGSMFERGHDVSERAALVAVAVQLGLAPDAEAVLAWLDSDEANRRVDAELARPRRLGINGIPSYVVQGRYRVGGMQEPGVFLDLFDRIRAKELGQDGGAPIGEVAQGSIVNR